MSPNSLPHPGEPGSASHDKDDGQRNLVRIQPSHAGLGRIAWVVSNTGADSLFMVSSHSSAKSANLQTMVWDIGRVFVDSTSVGSLSLGNARRR